MYYHDSTKFDTTFDGNGHVLKNLFINRPDDDNVGLFSITRTASVIQNVGLTSVNVTGRGDVGALVGDHFGDVQRSYAI